MENYSAKKSEIRNEISDLSMKQKTDGVMELLSDDSLLKVFGYVLADGGFDQLLKNLKYQHDTELLTGGDTRPPSKKTMGSNRNDQLMQAVKLGLLLQDISVSIQCEQFIKSFKASK
jgi:hypothetical protein